MKKCSIEGCDRQHKANGYCAPHNYRFKKYGDPSPEIPIATVSGAYYGPCVVKSCDRQRAARFDLCGTHRKKMTTYNLTRQQVIDLYDKFGGLCWCCKLRPATSIDHDHNCCTINSCGKCVRGVLCHRCNCAIGKLGDDIEGVLAALEYLRSYVPEG